MVSPTDLLDRAKAADDLAGLIKQGTGGTLLALATGLISGVLSVTDVVVKPMDALAEALGDLTMAIFGSPAMIIEAGALETAESIRGPFGMGPFTFAVGIGSVLLGVYLVAAYRKEGETGNLIPGLPFDVPFVGQDEEGD